MTHYKKNWMLLLTNRFISNKRVIIKTSILPSFLVHLIKEGYSDKKVRVINGKTDTVVIPQSRQALAGKI